MNGRLSGKTAIVTGAAVAATVAAFGGVDVLVDNAQRAPAAA